MSENKINWIATFEHTAGQAVSNDPTDFAQIGIVALEYDAAIKAANKELAKLCCEWSPDPNSRNRREPGTDSWWNSVTVMLWPQTPAAMALFVANGFDPANDPFHLIPAEAKAALADAEK